MFQNILSAMRPQSAVEKSENLPPLPYLPPIVEAVEAIRLGRVGALPPDRDHPAMDALHNLADDMISRARDELVRLVDHAMAVNGSTLQSAELMADLKEINQETQCLAASAEEMSASIECVATAAKTASDNAKAVGRSAAHSVQAIDRADAGMKRIAQALRQSEVRFAGLQAESKKMADLLSSVDAIACQTRMLALNAMIEAARAGSSGSGFQIVASEVRRLADQTTQATIAIRDSVAAVNKEMRSITEALGLTHAMVAEGAAGLDEARMGMHEVGHGIASVVQSVAEITQAIGQQSQATSQVAALGNIHAEKSERSLYAVHATISSMNRTTQVLKDRLDHIANMDLPGAMLWLAKSDHVFWKRHVSQIVAGLIPADEAVNKDHHQCRFGLWYDSVNDAEMSAHPAFRQIVQPHADVHWHGRAAVSAMKDGNEAKAIEELRDMEEASSRLMAFLDELQAWHMGRPVFAIASHSQIS
ncbi:MAG: methyl-accepting chemotaxis protein [Rhodospirillales bacterium]|nr:methyl-accepting chemotaxis protein [Rhodospirillales bacterium]